LLCAGEKVLLEASRFLSHPNTLFFVISVVLISQIRMEGLFPKLATPVVGAQGQTASVSSSTDECAPAKKTINEVYRPFNDNQSPSVTADFILPFGVCYARQV
jgi:hypothetical protein